MSVRGPPGVPRSVISAWFDAAAHVRGKEGSVSDEITLEHDVDAVLGLMGAEGAEVTSLLDEVTSDRGEEPEEPEEPESPEDEDD
jgi:hypothetical protein